MSYVGEDEIKVKYKIATLTDAQIKAQATTVLVPSTETLGYAGSPTRIFVPVIGYALLDTVAGAYTNVDPEAKALFAFGSDWSTDATIGNLIASPMTNAGLTLLQFVSDFSVLVTVAPATQINMNNVTLDGALQDNALAIAISNGAAGAFTGGHASNSLKVTVLYVPVDV